MRLLLDEMLSPRIASALRNRNHDVQAIKKDRPDLETLSDREIVTRMSVEHRAIVTDDIQDFQPIHDRLLAAGDEHYGMLFSFEDTMPRNKAALQLWIDTLDTFLTHHPAEDALRNRVHHLP